MRVNRVFRLEYRAPWHKASVTREVEPYHMKSLRGEWYLICFDRFRRKMLTYGISRLRAVEMLAEEAQGPTDFDIDVYLIFRPSFHYSRIPLPPRGLPSSSSRVLGFHPLGL